MLRGSTREVQRTHVKIRGRLGRLLVSAKPSPFDIDRQVGSAKMALLHDSGDRWSYRASGLMRRFSMKHVGKSEMKGMIPRFSPNVQDVGRTNGSDNSRCQKAIATAQRTASMVQGL